MTAPSSSEPPPGGPAQPRPSGPPPDGPARPAPAGPPRVTQRLLQFLLPKHEIADSIEGDLAEGFERRAVTSPGRAKWWYRGQVFGLPYVSLHREVRRLRTSGAHGQPWTGGGWMNGMLNGLTMDLGVAVRSLLRRPAFTGVALATLALSIGAATLIFSVVDGVLLSPLPYETPDRLVTVYQTSDEWRNSDNELLRNAWDVQTMSLHVVEAFRNAPGPLSAMGAYAYRVVSLDSGDGASDDATVIFVDSELFPLLGVEPVLGRLPSADELESGAPVAVLRHQTWSTRFGGDPDVIGRSFRLDDRALTVIGVMPPAFFFPTDDGGDLWAPIMTEMREWPSFYGIARLEPEATVADATDFFERVARRVGEDDPDQGGRGGRAVPHVDSVVGSVRGGLRLLFGTALLVVLVACANIANLFLARTASRREELAVRASLGAGMGSLTSTVLAEVLVIGVLGGGAGVVLAAGALDPFVGALASSLRELPRREDIGIDLPVLLFALGSTIVTILGAALGPVLVSARREPARALESRGVAGGASAGRGQRLLLSVQGTLTVLMVLAAALLGRSFLAAASVDMGIDTGRVAVLEIETDRERYPEAIEVRALQDEIRARLSSIPSVSAVGLASSMPSVGGVLLNPVRREGAEPGAASSVLTVTVGGDYFAAMAIPRLSGSGITNGRGDEVVGAVVSETLATRLFGRTDVVGERFLLGSGDEPDPVRVVGVVGESRQLSVFQPPAETLYYPMSSRLVRDFYVTLRTEGDPAAVLDNARAAIGGIDGALEISLASTLPVMIHDSMKQVRLRMLLMACLAVLAAVLAMIGISGVVAHYLSAQTREVGIRMALGAASGREVRRVVGQALWPTAVGVAVGLGLAVPASTVMQSFVFEIEPTDPLTYLAVTLLLLGSALLAAWIPARRAAAIDPMRVLNRGT